MARARFCSWTGNGERFDKCRNLVTGNNYRCPEHQVKRDRSSHRLTEHQKREIREYFQYRCAVAGCNERAHQIDHIREITDFPANQMHLANQISNLQLLCDLHHYQKTSRYIRENTPAVDTTSARNRKHKRMRDNGLWI